MVLTLFDLGQEYADPRADITLGPRCQDASGVGPAPHGDMLFSFEHTAFKMLGKNAGKT